MGLEYIWILPRLVLYADILPLAIARGKIFGIKGQSVVKSVYIQAPMNYFLIKTNINLTLAWIGILTLSVRNTGYLRSVSCALNMISSFLLDKKCNVNIFKHLKRPS